MKNGQDLEMAEVCRDIPLREKELCIASVRAAIRQYHDEEETTSSPVLPLSAQQELDTRQRDKK